MTETPDMDDKTLLAAEYVLGVLDRDARLAAQDQLGDPKFARLVWEWEQEFSHYADSYTAVTPPKSLKSRIEQQLFGAAPAKSWWGWGLGIAAACAILVFALLPRDAFEPEFTTRVETTAGILEADIDTDTDIIRVNFLGTLPAQNDLELWVISPDQAPVSLGVISRDRAEVTLPSGVEDTLSSESLFAISLEPKGGSPEAGPTGEVLGANPLQAL